jgi:hypothetical protein
MDRSFYGEYDNYSYRSAEEMSLAEQIESAEKALAAAMRLSKTNKSPCWDGKIAEIQQRIQQLKLLEGEQNG